MAQNPAQDYGRDIQCVVDADDLFTEVEGLGAVIQDALHSITQEDFLGPGGDGRGFDVRTLLGAKQSALTLAQPLIVEVLERDDRISTADVVLTETTNNGLSDIILNIHCETAFGPFDETISVLDLTSDDLEQGDAL
jgi:hypothetical protein